MKLGDLFWVKKLNINKDDCQYKDTIKVMDFVRDKFDIDLSYVEAFSLWVCFSESYCASWLCMSDSMLEEFKDYLEHELGE